MNPGKENVFVKKVPTYVNSALDGNKEVQGGDLNLISGMGC